jgi:hypothetical protein
MHTAHLLPTTTALPCTSCCMYSPAKSACSTWHASPPKHHDTKQPISHAYASDQCPKDLAKTLPDTSPAANYHGAPLQLMLHVLSSRICRPRQVSQPALRAPLGMLAYPHPITPSSQRSRMRITSYMMQFQALPDTTSPAANYQSTALHLMLHVLASKLCRPGQVAQPGLRASIDATQAVCHACAT